MNKYQLRKANQEDIIDIVTLLNDDILGKTRENIQNIEQYNKAFEEITQCNNIQLLVLENAQKEIIGTMQLIIIPCLSNMGNKRLEIEAVRISPKLRGYGVGSWMIKEAINIAKQHNCKTIQLTSNKIRIEAHKFYAKLGFISSHIGMKLDI